MFTRKADGFRCILHWETELLKGFYFIFKTGAFELIIDIIKQIYIYKKTSFFCTNLMDIILVQIFFSRV